MRAPRDTARSRPSAPAAAAAAALALTACHGVAWLGDLPDAGTAPWCVTCGRTADCRADQLCVEAGGAAACLEKCDTQYRCAGGTACTAAIASLVEVRWVCLPPEGACDSIGFGCGACPAQTVCDLLEERCVAPSPDGGPPPCPRLAPPSAVDACCRYCDPASAGCQNNGCPPGRWCETGQCRCVVPPADCMP